MSAIKEFFHAQIEQANRLYTGEELRQMEFVQARNRAAEKLPVYDILQLTPLNMMQLIEIAAALGMVVGDAKSKQILMYAILDKQAEITPALKGDDQTKFVIPKAPFRAGGSKEFNL